MRKKRADLTGNFLVLDCRLYCSAARMAQYQNDFDSENCCTVFQAADNLGRNYIPRHTRDKNVSNGLIKDEFDRDTRISAGEDGCERFLLICGMFSQNLQIVFNAGHVSPDDPIVTLHQ